MDCVYIRTSESSKNERRSTPLVLCNKFKVTIEAEKQQYQQTTTVNNKLPISKACAKLSFERPAFFRVEYVVIIALFVFVGEPQQMSKGGTYC